MSSPISLTEQYIFAGIMICLSIYTYGTHHFLKKGIRGIFMISLNEPISRLTLNAFAKRNISCSHIFSYDYGYMADCFLAESRLPPEYITEWLILYVAVDS